MNHGGIIIVANQNWGRRPKGKVGIGKMPKTKLSEHFFLEEFCSGKPTKLQNFMLFNLTENILEPLRSFANEILDNVTFSITSGIRRPSETERLKKQGYNPSETSDHNYGQCVKLRDERKKAIFGEDYCYSVGAADFIPSVGANVFFAACRPYFRVGGNIALRKNINVGQFILERFSTKGKSVSWIHVSNPPTLFFGVPILDVLGKKTCFLTSVDNGKTYQKVEF